MKREIEITIDDVMRFIKTTKKKDKRYDAVYNASNGYINLFEVFSESFVDFERYMKKLFGEELYDVIMWRLYDCGTNEGAKMTFDCDTKNKREYVINSDDDFKEMIEKEYLTGEKR